MKIGLTHPEIQTNGRAEAILPALGGYPPSDRPLFLAGYNELSRVDLNGKHAMEICGGVGQLAGLLAETFPESKVIGLDIQDAPTDPESRERLERLPGLSYVVGDAFDLSAYADESFDLIWGQAALHHLANNPKKLCEQVLRVLKPGGRLVFIFEPLGHNLLVAAIRAMRVSRLELYDESNLFFSQFQSIQDSGFSKCEVQVFNFLGYPMKAVSNRLSLLSENVQKVDSWLFRKFPKLLRYGANCNVIFTK